MIKPGNLFFISLSLYLLRMLETISLLSVFFMSPWDISQNVYHKIGCLMWEMISKKYRLPMIFKQLALICFTDIVFLQQCNFPSNAIKTVLVFFTALDDTVSR